MNHTKHKLIQSAGLIGFLTLLSRILGMFRDIVSAGVFGTSRVWDAFVLAFTIPNLLRRLLFEGALSSAFIPIFVEIAKTKGKLEAQKFANQVGTSFFIFVLIITAVFYGGFWFLNSFFVISGKWTLVLDFLAYLFPYLFFLLAVALSMGILSSEKHFFTPALSPVILNLSWIFAVLVICPFFSGDRIVQVKILCAVIVISGLMQLLVQWFPLRSKQYHIKLIWDMSSPYLAKFLRLILPSIVGFSVINLNILIDLVFGYFLPEGASSNLWYASRLMQFPLGLFAASLGTVLLPEYSHQAAGKDRSMIRETLSFSLRSVFLIILPATVGLIVLAHPIVETLFERGEFTAISTSNTQIVLIAYTLGLWAYSGLQVIVSAFYGFQDMKTPVMVGSFSLVFHLLLNLMLMQFMGAAGIALSTAISGVINFLILLVLFHKRISSFEAKRVFIFSFKIFGVSLFMGYVVWIVYHFCPYVPLMTSILAGIVIYVVGCLAIRVHEMRRMFEWIFVRK